MEATVNGNKRAIVNPTELRQIVFKRPTQPNPQRTWTGFCREGCKNACRHIVDIENDGTDGGVIGYLHTDLLPVTEEVIVCTTRR